MKTPEQLTEKLVALLGADLRSALLYGSGAVDDRTKRYSDFNVMLIVAKADAAMLQRVAAPVRAWVAAGNPPPVVVAEAEVGRSQDVFPIEFSDIRDRHRVLHGRADWLGAMTVNGEHLRHQLEFELRSKLLLLRQGYLAVAGRPKDEIDAMARSLSPIGALFRATLRLLGERVPASLPEVVRAIEARVSIDADAWTAVWRLRKGERPGPDAGGLYPRLISGMSALLEFIDARAR